MGIINNNEFKGIILYLNKVHSEKSELIFNEDVHVFYSSIFHMIKFFQKCVFNYKNTELIHFMFMFLSCSPLYFLVCSIYNSLDIFLLYRYFILNLSKSFNPCYPNKLNYLLISQSLNWLDQS